MKLSELNAEIGGFNEIKRALTSSIVNLTQVLKCVEEITEQIKKDGKTVDVKDIQKKIKKIEKVMSRLDNGLEA